MLRGLLNSGALFGPFTVVFSAAVVRFVALPLNEHLAGPNGTKALAIAEAMPPAVRSIYDPSLDQSFNLSSISAVLGYLLMGLMCTALDLFPKTTLTWKTQGSRSYFTVKEWLEAVGVSLGNMFFCSWLVTLPVLWCNKTGALRGGDPMSTFDDEFFLPMEVVKLIAHGFIIEVWFYLTHRALHFPYFYKLIHKMHHRFKAPTAVACMYAHPVEFNIGNVMGVILGPAITNCHPYTAAFWMCFSLVSTAGSHSGYKVFSARNHDWHHEHFDYCFGTSVFMDKLLGTDFEGSELWKKLYGPGGKKHKAHAE